MLREANIFGQTAELIRENGTYMIYLNDGLVGCTTDVALAIEAFEDVVRMIHQDSKRTA